MNAEALQRSCSVLEAFGREQRTELLTIVFTDIAGSAALKQQWGEHEAMVLVQRHHALIRELLGTFARAREVETAGDSFLLVFVQPSEAVKFVLQLQVRLRVLAQETGKPVWDRVGVHVGEVFVQEQAGAAKLFGSQVDVCARVMSLATANQVLISRKVFAQLESLLEVDEPQALSLKGFQRPIDCFSVRGMKALAS